MNEQMELQAREVRIRFVEGGRDGLIGWVSLIVGPGIRLNNIAIRKGRNGEIHLTYPRKIASSGQRYDHFNPVNQEVAAALENAVFAKLESIWNARRGPNGVC